MRPPRKMTRNKTFLPGIMQLSMTKLKVTPSRRVTASVTIRASPVKTLRPASSQARFAHNGEMRGRVFKGNLSLHSHDAL
jgi:hypothetical protein